MAGERVLVGITALAALLLGPGLADPAHAAPLELHSGAGLTVQSATPDGARGWRIVVSTAALSRPVRVDVLLPVGYDASRQRYPVLYLFHGTSGGADDWIGLGNAVAATAAYPLIVVMPDAGYDGNGGSWFTDWVDQSTALGASRWETFDLDELVPWVDANLRTVADRSGRAIAGLSQGGFGAFSYAARRPDLFASAASFSGAPDIASNPVTLTGAGLIVGATATALDGVEPFAMFGNPATDTNTWRAHDPASLVANLRSTGLHLWSGNGVPGPLDTSATATVQDVLIEGATHVSTLSFARAADRAHVAYTLDDYGNGTHSWPYWARDLGEYLPMLMADLARASAHPGPAGAARAGAKS